ncbi:MAG: DUF2993 domain-containing protein [Chthonomonadales bacterium]
MKLQPQGGIRCFSLLACLIIQTAGCGRTINRAAERAIRDYLPQIVGDARAWRAHVDNPPGRTIEGKLHRVTVDGADVDLHGAIRLARLHVEIRDLVVDVARKRVISLGSASFVATLSEADLTKYTRTWSAGSEVGLQIRSVHLRPQVVTVFAARRWLGKDWPFTIEMEPRLEPPARLAFDWDRMRVAGLPVPLPQAALRWVGHHLASGFDLSQLPFPVLVRGFAVLSGRVLIWGDANLNSLFGTSIQARDQPAGVGIEDGVCDKTQNAHSAKAPSRQRYRPAPNQVSA